MHAFIACTELPQRNKLQECKALFEQIESEWSRDDEAGLYRMHYNSENKFTTALRANQDCLLGLHPKSIEKLFGKPDMLLMQNMVYYLREPCLEKKGMNAAGCQYLIFNFGKDQKMVGLAFTTTTFKD